MVRLDPRLGVLRHRLVVVHRVHCLGVCLAVAASDLELAEDHLDQVPGEHLVLVLGAHHLGVALVRDHPRRGVPYVELEAL
ncbi:hypothetical protein GCM10011410_11250 [Hoyosella rhizosphaerae]|uniref:Uncharacterized protein n=1 Tax=Hoyosella rhizosphaerae TaxID=1755582 RepID=A0A916U762_9ACTN|nr:hypothetical protein GCM10011410_11250 [Hoyosella rhizosphaerae]